MFGDTWRVGHGIPNDDLGSIAFCTDKTADAGLGLTFLSRPPLVPGIAQGGFDVPLDGASANGRMYVFFSTDAPQAGIYSLMGRSILARSDDGLSFTLLYEVSRYKFVNVSTMIVDAAEHGLPGTGPQLASSAAVATVPGTSTLRLSRSLKLLNRAVSCFTRVGSADRNGARPRTTLCRSSARGALASCRSAGIRYWAPGPVFITPTGRQTDHRSAV